MRSIQGRLAAIHADERVTASGRRYPYNEQTAY
jgi:hypothetical protein